MLARQRLDISNYPQPTLDEGRWWPNSARIISLKAMLIFGFEVNNTLCLLPAEMAPNIGLGNGAAMVWDCRIGRIVAGFFGQPAVNAQLHISQF
jgi:hypothetical protein